MRIRVLAPVLCPLLAASLSLAGTGGRDSVAFLNLGTGGRPLALGGAFTSIADDSNALFYNPAGLGLVKSVEASVMYNRWLADTSYSHLGLALPLARRGTVAGSLLYLGTPKIEAFDSSNQSSGSFSSSDMAFSLGYGRSLGFGGKLLGGIGTKFVREVVAAQGANAFSADLGLLYCFQAVGLPLQAGLFGGNFGNSVRQIQAASRQASILRLGLSGESRDGKGLASFELTKQFDDDPELRFGVEYRSASFREDLKSLRFALRTGYAYEFGGRGLDGFAGLSGGFGVRFESLKLDYAVTPWGDLGLTHVVSLAYQGHGPAKSDRVRGVEGQAPPRSKTPLGGSPIEEIQPEAALARALPTGTPTPEPAAPVAPAPEVSTPVPAAPQPQVVTEAPASTSLPELPALPDTLLVGIAAPAPAPAPTATASPTATSAPSENLQDAVALLKIGNTQEALGILSRLSKASPRDASIYLYTGAALRMQGRNDKATAYFQAAEQFAEAGSAVQTWARKYLAEMGTSSEPAESPAELLAKAGELLSQRRADEALGLLGRVSKLAPREGRIYLYTGLALALKGEREKSVPYFQAAAQLSPLGSDVYRAAQSYLAQLGGPAKP